MFTKFNRFFEEPWVWLEKFSDFTLEDFPFNNYGSFFNNEGKVYWQPAANVKKEQNQVVIEVDLPGMNDEDIKISIEKDHLIIEGTRKDKENQIDKRYGKFIRAFQLSDSVDIEKITATYNKGVLIITIPKVIKDVPKKIEIKITK